MNPMLYGVFVSQDREKFSVSNGPKSGIVLRETSFMKTLNLLQKTILHHAVNPLVDGLIEV